VRFINEALGGSGPRRDAAEIRMLAAGTGRGRPAPSHQDYVTAGAALVVVGVSGGE